MLELSSEDTNLNTLFGYFDACFQDIKGELKTHSKLLHAMDSRIQQLTELTIKLAYMDRPMMAPRDSESGLNKLQDSTGANPKEFTLKDMLRAAAEQSQKKAELKTFDDANEEEGKVRNYKKQTPSFGRVAGYLTNPKEEDAIVETIKAKPKNKYKEGSNSERNVREEICLDSFESSSEEANINSIFSPTQEEKESKKFIIEPIDIEVQDINSKRISEKPSTSPTPSNELKKIIIADSLVGLNSNSRNPLSYSVTTLGKRTNTKSKRKVKKKPQQTPQAKEKAQNRPGTSASVNKGTSFESFRSLDQQTVPPRPKSPGNLKSRGSGRKIRFQEYAAPNLKLGAFQVKNLPKPHRPRSTEKNGGKKIASTRKNIAKVVMAVTKLEGLPIKCLNLIGEFIGDIVPPFVLCSKAIMHKYIPFKMEEVDRNSKLLQRQYIELTEEINNKKEVKKSFKLPIKIKRDYESLKPADWLALHDKNMQKTSYKDIMIIKLYFAFLGICINEDTDDFLLQLNEFVSRTMARADLARMMDPEKNFDFTEANVIRIKELLLRLKEETMELANTSSNNKLFDVFASIILEGLQHAQIIPATIEAELDDLDRKIHRYSEVRHSLQKLIEITKS